MRLIQSLLRHKSVEQLQAELGARRDFRRVLGVWQLTAIGLGGIIGVGIFVLAGQQAAANAGPAVAISFLIAGIASAAAALCYAEFAGLIPVTGSAYTYGYATLGEFIAWLIGWDLLLEYALIVAVVAIGWSGYVQSLLGAADLHLPVWAQGAMGTGEGRVFNVIAALVTLAVAALLVMRTEWGARFNTLIVAIKVLAVVIVVGIFFVDPANWHPFIPERVVGADGVGHFGFKGVATAAAVVFFAVFGYDADDRGRGIEESAARPAARGAALARRLDGVLSRRVADPDRHGALRKPQHGCAGRRCVQGARARLDRGGDFRVGRRRHRERAVRVHARRGADLVCALAR